MSGGIIALDLATVTGFALSRGGGEPRYGSKRIGSVGCSEGRFFADFEQWLSDIVTIEQPRALIFEAPILTAGKTSIQTARRLMGLAVITDLIGYKREIPIVREVDNSSVRKHFTGRGRWANRAEGKAMVMQACRERGWSPKDDNAADALACLDFAISILEPKRAAGQTPLFARSSA